MTTEHLFTDCEALGLLRLNIFGTLNPILCTLTTGQFVRFLDEANIDWLPFAEV